MALAYTWTAGDTITAARLLAFSCNTVEVESSANSDLVVIKKTGGGAGNPISITNSGTDAAIEVDGSDVVNAAGKLVWASLDTAKLDDLTDVNTISEAKGMGVFYDGDNSRWDALAVGTNNQVLTADSAQAPGVKWADASGGAEVVLGHTNIEFGAGSQAITGVGFEPKVVMFMFDRLGVGWDNATGSYCTHQDHGGTWKRLITHSMKYWINGSTTQQCVVASMDADGFTLTWTVTGSPAGSMTYEYIAIG